MANVPAGLYQVDPISRIEGHLGVKVQTDGAPSGATITEAWAHGNLWRGFENFLIGRNTNDAITFTQRICGVCPLPHATASTFATESVLGVSDGYITFADDGAKGVPAKAVLIRNLTYAAEFLMSAITHFYHLAAPSYVQGPNMPPWTPYFDNSQYSSYLRSGGAAVPSDGPNGFSANLWSAVIKQYVKALRIRRLTFEGGALFAGRMPMISSYVAGGVTNETVAAGGRETASSWTTRCNQFEAALTEVGKFILKEYVPVAMALGALYPAFDNTNNAGGMGYGAGCKNFLAWGAFPGGMNGTDATLAIKGGYKLDGGSIVTFMSGKGDLVGAKAAVAANLREYITRSRYANSYEYATVESAYPGDVSRTVPERDMSGKYSWMKAPRWNGNAMEVGPLARMVVNGLYADNAAILSTLGVASLYTKTISGNTGVDPALVDPDLAVALVRARFAKLVVDPAGTPLTVDDTNINGLPTSGVVNAYMGGNSIIIDGADVPLVTYLTTVKGGYSTIDRLRARALESAYLVQKMIGSASKGNLGDSLAFGPDGWIDGLKTLGSSAGYKSYALPAGTVSGFGVSEAPRGALAHFVTSTGGRIAKYQCVVPTTWNGSPKDGADGAPTTKRGPIEQAMIGVPFDAATTANGRLSGVEVLRVAQSFDPCIACAVH
ncbi:MAG TPA: nickel-dependent hydrogenase large subunit [Coriobacteriia bacterium]|jgi:hydrogenase large subunit